MYACICVYACARVCVCMYVCVYVYIILKLQTKNLIVYSAQLQLHFD